MHIGFPRLLSLAGLATALGLLVAACGGSDATATPAPTATPTARPVAPTPTPISGATAAPTATAASATATSVAPAATSVAAATAAPVPAATPVPSNAVPTPSSNTSGKRGGILNTSIRTSYIVAFDTFTSNGGRGAVPAHNLLLNNLVWTDPYGKDQALVGDAAESWSFSDGGKVITFQIRKGITFHDGKPLTAKDVVYNIERAWHPRSPTMTEFKGKIDPLQKVEMPDDYTVKLTLDKASNVFLGQLSISQFLIYPAHMPLPEFNDQWKQTGIGGGPFKLKTTVADAKIETVRNDSYFRPGFPYLEGVNLTAINDDGLLISSYRTGRLDATSLDFSPLQRVINDGTLKREIGWTSYPAVIGAQSFQFAQKDPFLDPRVREAVDLGMNRQDVSTLAYDGLGNPYASPMLPPDMGGKWGLSADEMKNRPGYRDDKTQDIVRAKQLLKDAGVDPSKFKLRLLGSTPLAKDAEAIDSSMRALGFQTEVQLADTGPREDIKRSGNFELSLEPVSIQLDDPLDFLVPFFKTGGAFNFAKWSDPQLDALMAEQDATLDLAKRKQLIRDMQERILKNRYTLFTIWRINNLGHSKAVKNYPPKLPFLFDARYKWEQVWLER